MPNHNPIKEAMDRIKPFLNPLYIAHNKGIPMQMSIKFICLKVGIFLGLTAPASSNPLILTSY